MINYKFGDIRCKIDFNDFLKITINDNVMHKSDFKCFSDLYEIIDKNTKYISHILFDGYEYILEKGLLHNLYGAALIRYNSENTYIKNYESKWFYIDGKLVHNTTQRPDRGCSKTTEFLNEEIIFYKELSGRRSSVDPNTGKYYRRKEGVDYETTIINLKERVRKDQRYKKLKNINELQ